MKELEDYYLLIKHLHLSLDDVKIIPILQRDELINRLKNK